jgi:hypothetical protein
VTKEQALADIRASYAKEEAERAAAAANAAPAATSASANAAPATTRRLGSHASHAFQRYIVTLVKKSRSSRFDVVQNTPVVKIVFLRKKS